MKTSLFLICITFFFSCSKEPNEPNNNPPLSGSGSVQYKVNGQLIVMDNVDLVSGQYVIFYKQLKGSALPDTRYMLNAQKGSNNVFLFPIVTDSLQEINYRLDSAVVRASASAFTAGTTFNGNQSFIIFDGDYFDVNITSYENSRISGTFTGRFTAAVGFPATVDYNSRGTVLITEGVLNNVQVIY